MQDISGTHLNNDNLSYTLLREMKCWGNHCQLFLHARSKPQGNTATRSRPMIGKTKGKNLQTFSLT